MDLLDGRKTRIWLKGMPKGPKQQELQETKTKTKTKTKTMLSTTMIDLGPRLPKEGGLRFPKE